MNFRKRISIMKGVRLNASKSGVSMTVGGKGLSLNVGKGGLFLNTSIPGTGLYDRKKLVDFDKKKATGGKKSGKSGRVEKPAPQVALPSGGKNIRLAMGADGEVIVFDKDGRLIEDPAALEKLSRTASYRAAYRDLMESQGGRQPAQSVPDDAIEAEEEEEFGSEAEAEETFSFDQIMRLAADVPGADAYTGEAEWDAPEEIEPEAYDEPAPSRDGIRRWLEAEAEKNVQSIAFWNVQKKRDEFVESRLETEYARQYDIWQKRKQAFEEKQAGQVQAENERIRAEHQARIEAMRRGVNADQDYVEEQIEAWLGELEMPIDFNVEFEYDRDAGMLMADLDLPEIEQMPDEKTITLASGRTSIKPKSQKELRQDYVNCVLGLGVFCASHFFCVTPDMERILLSAYTQRRSKKTGDLQNDYIYSVVFERAAFERRGYQRTEPEAFIGRFKSRMIKLASGELKPVEPYMPEDAGE